MTKDSVKFYRLLARFLYLKELMDKSFDKDMEDMVEVDRSEWRTSTDPNIPFKEKEPIPDDIPTPNTYKARTPIRQGERIQYSKEMEKLEIKLLEMYGSESMVSGKKLHQMEYSDLPKKHIQFINGYRRFIWNEMEFNLNELQADCLENIYNHFSLNESKYIVGKQFCPDGKRDIVKAFGDSNIIGNILVRSEQGVYEINLDF